MERPLPASGLATAAVAALALVAGTLTAAAQTWQPLAVPDDGAWTDPSGRMSLGMRAETWAPEDAAPRRRRGEQCRKWRRMADRLGETYAGHALRTSVLREVCGMLEPERTDEAWDFPWGGLARGRVMPPRHLSTVGAWELRCGSAGRRRRCAAVALLGGPARAVEGEAVRPVAHFVIDMVGGREALLWRLFVPADRGTAVTELGQRDQATSSDASSTPAARRGHVRYRLGEREHVESFPACAASGCLMEANVVRGGAVATRLVDGLPVDLVIEQATGRRLELQLPAAGFRAAFNELLRLRREERRAR